MPEVQLQRVTASGQANLDFITGFSSSYDTYILRFQNLRRDNTMPGGWPGQEGVFIATSGTSYDTGNYYTTSAIALVNQGLAPTPGPNPVTPQGIYQIPSAATGLIPSVDCLNPSDMGLCGDMMIFNDGTNKITYNSDVWRPDQLGDILKSLYSGYYSGSTARITAMRLSLVPSGALFISGTVDLIGISH